MSPPDDPDRIAALERRIGRLRELLAEMAQDKASMEKSLREQRLRHEELVQNVPWLVARVGADRKYLDVNRYFVDLLGGVSPLDREVGSCGEGEAFAQAVLSFCQDSSTDRQECEVELDGGDARSLRLVLGRGAFDNHVSVLGVDNTELHRALRDARAAAERADQANRAKTDFLAVMSHEIRTPLHGILGMAELLLDGALPPSSRQTALQIDRSGNDLLKVVNDVLDLTKVESGKVELESIPFYPAQIVASVRGLFVHNAREKGLAFDVTLTPRVPGRVLGDPTRLTQILSNLVSNAIKFTREGSVSLHADYVQDSLIVEVRDTGIGISEVQRARLFEPFAQAERSTTRQFGGSGLGLSISQRLVVAMGGELTLESEAGRGTTFLLTLPAEVVDEVSLIDDDESLEILQERVAAARPHVLVAEDNPVNQMLAVRFLDSLRCRVTVANDGHEAVEHAKNESFDLVFMDVNMPRMDGHAATRAIRQLPGPAGEVRIVAMTANAIQGDRDACLAAGMDGYVGKPFRREDLLRAIHRFARLRGKSAPRVA